MPKKKGQTCDYTSARNAELVEMFRRELRKAGMIDLDRIFQEISNLPASRFYISEERALALIKEKRRTGRWSVNSSLRCEMMEEISSRIEKLMALRKDLSMEDAAYHIINRSAPKFYLTPRSCRTLIYSTLRRAALRELSRKSLNNIPRK